MKCCLKHFVTLIVLISLSVNSHAQLVVNTVGVTANDLVNQISGAGVIISNPVLNCPNGAYGTFSGGGTTNLGLNSGIILTTGDAALAPGPNSSASITGGPCTSYSDPDLTAIEPLATNDVCRLEFDIIPQCDTLRLQYVFASDEYPEFVNGGVNDAFGFFVSGPNPLGGNYTNFNIALIPGTGTPIAIDNVNNGNYNCPGPPSGPCTNCAYYIDNCGGATLEYDGLTVVLTAEIPVDRCATYSMKLIIADAGDCAYDSGVFLDFEGLTCPNNDVSIVPVDTNAYEGCGDAHFQITRTDVTGPFTVTTSTGGTATNPADYTINGSYTFANGQGVIDVFVPAIDDDLLEGNENAWIYISYDVCGISVTDSIEILIHDEIHLTFTSVDPACGACDGSATVNVTGGTPPYSYQWDAAAGNQTTQTATNLCAGNYCVTVTDANGCVETQCVTLNASSGLTLTVTVTDETCQGDNDGTINVTVAGGSGNYTYDIGGPTQGTGLFTGLAPGNYTVTVLDNISGCTETANVTVVAGPVCCTLAPTAAGVDASCNGACDGTATATPTGSVGGVSYVWLQGGVPIGQTTQTATGLCAGTYTVDVTDANCTMSASVTINEPPALTLTATEVPVTCNAACDGQINATGGGGTPALEYSIDGVTFQPGTNFTGLCAGPYTVTIRDANGCLLTVNVTVTEPPALTGSATEVPNTCNGACDGQINVTAGGGTAPLEYSLDGITFQPGTNFTGLCAGPYTVTIRDANGCLLTVNVTVTEPPAITGSATEVPNTCNGACDGQINVTGGGGTAPLEYSLDGITFQPGTNFTGLCAGPYTVTIRDANGCILTVNVTVTEPPAVTGSATEVPNTCNAACDGQINVTGGGGTAPLEYSLDGITFQPGTNFTGLCAGPYTVTIRDANGCLITVNVTVTEPPAVTIAVAGVTDATCGQPNGSITVAGGGGIPPLQYSIDGGTTWQAGTTFGGLLAGAYNVIVEDANGCQATVGVNVADQSGLIASIGSQTAVTCNGGSDGSVTINASGSTATPYQYSIDGGVTWQAGGVFAGLPAGPFTITVEDANGCQVVVNGTINEPPAITGSATEVPNTCNGACDGQIDVTGGGGVAPLEYSLDGITFQPGTNFSGLCAGPYTVTIRDANGCIFTVNVTVTEPPALTGSATEVANTCFGACDGQINATGGGGTAPLEYSLDGITFQPGPNFTGLCAGPYTVTIRDANGCVLTVNVTVTEPTQVSVAVTNIVDGTCGLPNGSVTVSGAGGTPTYQYSIDGGTTWQAGTTFGSLGAGSYTITIQDANGCTATVPATVNDLSGLTASIATQTDVSCNGGSDGVVAITAGGSVGPYLYSIDGGVTFQGSPNFSGLAAGPYTITVEDANGCQVTVAVTINEPPVLSVTAVPTDNSCGGACDGEIDATGAGGVGPYQYSLDGITFQPGTNFSALCAGPYTVTIADANGCTATVNVTVNEPTAVGFNATSVNSTCGLADGSITVTGNGGTPGYQYSIDGGPLQGSGVFNGLMAGTYTIMVEDANGCQFTNTVNVSNNAAPVINNTAFTDPVCNGACDGTIDVTASGGTGALLYSINGGAQQASNIFNGLCAGTYDIMVEDANGCQTFDQVVLTDPPAVTYTAAITDLACYQDNTGSITITASGGNGTYTYSIDGGVTFQAGNAFNGLAAGTYNISVMDGVGCIGTGTETVVEPPELTMTFATFDATCNGQCDGSAIVIPSGGTIIGLYDFTWTAPGVGNTANATGLCAGTYTLTVMDDNGCTIDTTFTIAEPTPFTITTSATASTCNQPDGTASVDNVTGGTAGYTYLWDANAMGQTTATATGLIPGNYDVTIFDANGCDSTVTVNVPNMPGVVGSLLTSTDALCNGACDGTAEVTQAGGTAPYTYLWNDNSTNALHSNLCAGQHWVEITDATGCTDTVYITINEPTPVTVTTSVDTTICIGGTATLSANGAGGTPGYTYDWNGGAFAGSPINDSPLANTSYTVIVTDANGCVSAPATVNVSLLTPLNLVMSPDLSICEGESANISGTASGGDGGPYNYNWTNDDGTGWTATGNTHTVTPPITTVYYLTVTDGCETPAIIDSVTITVNPTPQVTFNAADVDGCAPLTVTLVNTSDPLLIGSNCLWDLGDGNTSTDCNSVTHTYELPGSYDVTLTFTSPAGCVGTTTVANYINVYPNPVASFVWSPDPATIVDQQICFDNTSILGDFWDWNFNEMDSSSLENPCWEFPGAGSYWTSLTVTTINGCTDTYVDTVLVNDVFSIYVPNAFTPDGDGVNDFFFPVIEGADEEALEFYIFNRWGERIFEAYHEGRSWDGTYKGIPVKQEVYVWKVITKDAQTGDKHEYVGHVTLLR